jgi:RNA polymerase sigma-19 factor, ECF subfamily
MSHCPSKDVKMTGMERTPSRKLIRFEENIPGEIKPWNNSNFSILYNYYWQPLLQYAALFIRDQYAREEIVQELFVHLYTRGSRLTINTSLSSYLFVALRNKIFNYLRSQAIYKKHVTTAGREKWDNKYNNNVEQSIDLMELQKEISFSLNHMAAKYKEVYVLHEQRDCTVKKISAILNRPVDTVEKQLRKAVNLLREHLRGENMVEYAVR